MGNEHAGQRARGRERSGIGERGLKPKSIKVVVNALRAVLPAG